MFATGGVGGSIDNGNGPAGSGGDASASLTLKTTAATSTYGSATATGGDSGAAGVMRPIQFPGADGNASATVAVTVDGGEGRAVAGATGGSGAIPGTANAHASVSGATSGSAQATSVAHSDAGSVTAKATSPVGGPASATTMAEIGTAPLPTPSAALGETVSYAELTPANGRPFNETRRIVMRGSFRSARKSSNCSRGAHQRVTLGVRSQRQRQSKSPAVAGRNDTAERSLSLA